MKKIYNFLNKDINEFNKIALIVPGILFIIIMGLISYKVNIKNSFALFQDQVEGQKTITIHYEEQGKIFSENVLKVLKSKASTINDGVYFFDEDGNLDYGDGTVIDLNLKIGKPQGVVSIWNKTPIYVCTKYNNKNYEYDQTTKQVNPRTLPCLEDRYQNLVINGDLSYGDNTNLSEFGNYNNEGYLSKTNNSYIQLLANDYIPIDPNKKYKISVDAKSSNTDSTYYAGVIELDADKSEITAAYSMYIPNTLTELAQDLSPGDNTIYLKDLTNWDNNTSTRSYQRGFIFWNYKDSTGYEYPELTYSKNKYATNPALYEDSAVDKVNNTITLPQDSTWTGPAISKGTKVSQSSSGSTYNYSVFSGRRLTVNWATYTASITGVNTNGNVNSDYTKFRPGAKFVKFFIIGNDNSTPDTTTYIKNISIKEVKD